MAHVYAGYMRSPLVLQDHWRLLHEAGRAFGGAFEPFAQAGGVHPLLGQGLRHKAVVALAKDGGEGPCRHQVARPGAGAASCSADHCRPGVTDAS